MSARAADYPIKVACPAWSADAVAQVEARVRTTLLVERLDARQVSIVCAPENAVTVAVESEYGSLELAVARQAERVEDDVVSSVEDALRRLIPPITEPVAAEPAPAEPPAPAAPAPVVSQPPAAPPASAPAPKTAATSALVTELHVTPTGELWGGTQAFGAEAGMSVGSDRFGYGLAVGGRAALNAPSTFDVQEWAAVARVSFTLPPPSGLRFSAGVGASLLAASPTARVVAQSALLLGVASFDAKLSRPFWVGAFGLSPELGVRLFSARRNVLVDGHEQVALPLAVPEIALSLIYRR